MDFSNFRCGLGNFSNFLLLKRLLAWLLGDRFLYALECTEPTCLRDWNDAGADAFI